MPILIFFSFLSFFAIGNYWPILLKLSTLELHITLRWFSSQFLVCLFSCPFSFSDSFLAPYTIIFLALISLPFSLLQVLSWEISPIYRASFFFFYHSPTILGINTDMYLQYLLIPNPNLLLLVELFYLKDQFLLSKQIKNRKQNSQVNQHPRQHKIKKKQVKWFPLKFYRTYYPSFKTSNEPPCLG